MYFQVAQEHANRTCSTLLKIERKRRISICVNHSCTGQIPFLHGSMVRQVGTQLDQNSSLVPFFNQRVQLFTSCLQRTNTFNQAEIAEKGNRGRSTHTRFWLLRAQVLYTALTPMWLSIFCFLSPILCILINCSDNLTSPRIFVHGSKARHVFPRESKSKDERKKQAKEPSCFSAMHFG